MDTFYRRTVDSAVNTPNNSHCQRCSLSPFRYHQANLYWVAASHCRVSQSHLWTTTLACALAIIINIYYI